MTVITGGDRAMEPREEDVARCICIRDLLAPSCHYRSTGNVHINGLGCVVVRQEEDRSFLFGQNGK